MKGCKLVFVAIVAAHVLFNLFVSDRHQIEWIQRVTTGARIAQPVLFAAWAALGSAPATIRIPLTIATLIAVETAAGARLAVDATRTTCFEILVITLPLFLGAALALWIARIFKHWVIVRRYAETDVARSQFSLKYLIGLTTATAFLLGLGKILLSADYSASNFDLTDFAREAAAPLAIMLLATLPAVAAPLFVLSHLPDWRSIIALFTFGLLTSFCAIWLLASIATQPLSTSAEDIFGIQAGAIAAGTLTAIPLRLVGYRLTKKPASLR
jgi:hypothetical protein